MATRDDVTAIVNSAIDTRVPGIVQEIVYPIVNKVKQELADHIDRKTAEVRSDLVVMARKIDYKSDVITDKLVSKKVFSRTEAVEIKNLSPFPRVVAQ